MANKNDFTPEEWTKVLESIMVAGIAVSAADPSGLWGTLKEAAAGSLALAAAKRDPNSNELVKAAIADFERSSEGSILAMRERFAQAEPTSALFPPAQNVCFQGQSGCSFMQPNTSANDPKHTC